MSDANTAVLPLWHPRVMGVETEYMVTPSKLPLATEILHKNVRSGLGLISLGDFLENGSRFYVDTGSHPEYASPECLSGLSVAKAIRVGDVVVSNALLPVIESNRDAIKRRPGLFKRSLAQEDVSVGIHENYYVRGIKEGTIAPTLVPHLVSRIIFTGSGLVDEAGRYKLDQRSQVMTNTCFDVSSVNQRPFVLNRNEPLSNDGGRLQVLSGSANMLDAATQFKLDSTSLVIRMIEHGLLPPGMTIDRPGEIARYFAAQTFQDNFTFDRSIKFGGKTMTAPAIQLYYASIAKAMADEGVLNEYDSMFAHLWYEMAVDAHDGKIDKWKDSIDWLAKLALIERQNASRQNTSKARLRQIDIAYHRIPLDGERTVIDILQDKGEVQQIFSDEEIRASLRVAPDATRARQRGQFILSVDGLTPPYVSQSRQTWSTWTADVVSKDRGYWVTRLVSQPSPYGGKLKYKGSGL